MKKYKRIQSNEREIISQMASAGQGPTAIAKRTGRHKSSISRELKPFREQSRPYSAFTAQHSAMMLARKHHCQTKLRSEESLRNFVEEKLKDKWSPVQIAQYLKEHYADNPQMQLSHESIYTYIYLLPRGELRKRLIKGLRQAKATRKRRIRTNKQRGKILDMISIEERPAAVADRSVAGHWEGDLLMGKRHQSAMGSIVERKTRTLILVPLQGADATTVREAFEQELKTLPEQMRLSMTYDQRQRNVTAQALYCKYTDESIFLPSA